MKKNTTILIITLLILSFCSSRDTCHQEMIVLLKQVEKNIYTEKNIFSPRAKLVYMDSLLTLEHTSDQDRIWCQFLKANILLELGKEKDAIGILEAVSTKRVYYENLVLRELAMSYMRMGERENCINNHAAESCIVPFQGVGVHQYASGSYQAIKIYKRLLEKDPEDLESRWLLNLAYMTVDEYPENVPAKYLIPGMEGDTTEKIKPFVDISADLKLNIRTMAGGSITEDFDNDGYLDLVVSALYVTEPVQFFRNNGDGSFSDRTTEAGLDGISGGLNITQTDFNNDGYKDIFVLRGGWQGEFGSEPNSLLRNNGDGTFTDITTTSGLLSFHPTQTATWNDFNNDGLLDVFIGNETSSNQFLHPCELYLNNGDETFREIASLAKCDIIRYVKGVTSGDYDNDGWVDIFISTMHGERFLLHNDGIQQNEVRFTNVTKSAGITEGGNTFPTWFWDYDNDGWMDIFVCDYSFKKTLAYYAAAEKLGIQAGNPNKMLLYHNNHDGTFTNVAPEAGINKVAFAMGSNFGDINNDGFLDFYLGTGNPPYQSLVPNKMFMNKGGQRFADVTASARVGHLQKGHGVSFADMDNDGDQDIHIEMGGAYPGDAYENAFFLNPGQNTNNWITIDLTGTKSNRCAIGSRVTLFVTEGGQQRKIVRDVNSGGSFGSSPLRREIGVGSATQIDKIEIQWRGSNVVETHANVKVNQFIRITEGSAVIETLPSKPITWKLPELLCAPVQ